MADFLSLSASAGEGLPDRGAVDRAGDTLARKLKAESTTFRSGDVVQITTAAQRLSCRHPPLLEAVASHVLRGMLAYPLFALCNIVNSFARLDYHQHRLLEAVATFLAEPSRAEQLTPIDIASLVFAYAQLSHRAGPLLEACSRRVIACQGEVGGPNCAIILNSYARLSECNPELFHVLARSAIATQPGSFDVHHISLIMNAFAKCQIRKPQMMHLLGGFLEGRVQDLSPQNVSNIANAFAKLECYNHQVFHGLQTRIYSEDLSNYKLFELSILAHSLAKLKCGGQKTYGALFSEAARRTEWEPQSVAQVLDAMRRKRAYYHEPLALMLMQRFLEGFRDFAVHPLTQTAWCLVELDALDMAEQLPPGLVQASEGESAGLAVMRMVLERMEELSLQRPLTATQQRYVQQLVRAYHYKHEVDYGLLPQRTKAFCKALFDVPTAVVSSVARRGGGGGGPR